MINRRFALVVLVVLGVFGAPFAAAAQGARSEKTARAWGGSPTGRFCPVHDWPVFRCPPREFTKEGETLQVAAQRCLSEIGVAAKSLWAVEHTYTIFNRRYEDIQLILVLAAEVEDSSNIRLSWEHSEYRWCTAQECEALLGFRGLLEGLHWTRKYVSEATHPLPELRLSQ